MPNIEQKPALKTHIFKLKLILLLLSLIFSLFSLTLSAQDIEYYNHPELEWQTIETEHFLVHYHQGTERTANVVAKIAEEVYPHITGLYQYKPASKTEFIIRDTEDYANGGAYFFDNKVEIWAENLDYVLRGTHNWLRDVVTHEYTHIISLQKALKFSRHVPAGWLQVFGYEEERRADVVRGFPDVLVSYPIAGLTIPAWFAEGVAQFQSSSKRYDYRDSHREMILRDRVMTGNLLSLDEMGTFGKNSIGNESSYNLGYALVNFLTENYGDTVVAKMAEKASAPFRLSFSDAMKSVTGVSAEELYRQWATHLKDTYTKRLNTITANERIGEAFVEKGIGNLYPTVSPSGKKIAYLTTADADYLSQNKLVVEDIQSGEKQIVAPKVTRSISWSPDNRYLAYAKVTPEENTASMYNDIYVYDLEEEKEYRLTRSLRARHPDWSHDGQKLTFVVESDGLTNLYVLELGNPHFAKSFNDTDWKDRCYHLNKHVIVNSEPDGLSGSEHLVYRDVGFKGVKLRQLTHFVNGRQIYHPRWAPDDSYIIFDTSIEFARDIAKIPAEGGEMSFVLKSPSDERYPIFHPNTGELFYADDQTGIFNIYSLDLETGESKAYTNVVGGAFMPSLTPDGDLYYSLYRDVGYKIHHIANADTIRMSKLTYLENYEKTIPRIEVNDKVSEPLSSKAYSFSFPGVSLMPRLLIDYGTVKPGLYASTNEILNKMLFFGGFDFNFRKDYNIFAIFNFNLFKPTFFIEAYNQSQNITDNVSLEGYTPEPEVDINFNLLEVDIGLEGHWLPWMFEGFYARLAYIFSFYRARINTFGFRDPASGRFFEFAPIRYDYLRGHSLSLFLRYENVKRDIDRAINPRGGRYVTFKVQREWNRFLDDFATDRVVNLEIFKKYYFNRFELNWEEYYSMPYSNHHSLTLRFQGGFTDAPVDSFFHFFGGGIVGLKGYPFYSVEGRRMAMGSATYRFPLFQNINKQVLNMFFDKLYLGGFFQYGYAWSQDEIRTDHLISDISDNFLSDVGIQLRLDTFSWYFFPTRIFFEAAYPLEEHINQNVRYPQEWKFYFGVLFDFGLRLENRRPGRF